LATTANKIQCHWGWYEIIYQDTTSWTRALTILGGESLSLHYHEFRQELWFPLDEGLTGIINGGPTLDLAMGNVYSVPRNVLHRIINDTDSPKRLIEVAHGAVDDEDITLIYDKYRS
jgi:mannose-6-phosphate isomerase-like protein (cupin superfamily)